MTERKRFIAKQAIGGLLVSLTAVAILAIIFGSVAIDFWSAIGLVSWLAVGGAIALSVLRLIRSDDHHIG